MAHVITVVSNGKNITIQPTRIWLAGGKGNQELVWKPAGSGSVKILDIRFDDPNPISGLGPVQGSDDWAGTDDTETEGTFKYTITLRVDGQDLPPLDPEVENGPPGGIEEGGG